MSSVFKARDTRLDRDVAIKIIPDPFVDQASRLRREARALSKLDHPNIVKVFDIASEHGVDFIVMELVQGRCLQDVLSAGPLSAIQTRAIALQAASALSCAHQAGVVHRDLKPGNIMLDSEGRVRLLDFGIAKIERARDPETLSSSSSDTFTGTMAGTPSYMSPEQLQGGEIDARADLFSLGVVLYEMLSGRRPFAGRTYAETMAAILYRDPDPLRGVPRSLERVVLRCLRRDPDLRFGSAREVLDSLDQPVPAAGTGVPLEPSVAVLPFANLSPDPGNDYFSDGLSEELIVALQRIPGLRVIARSSSFQFRTREIPASAAAQRLGVDYVVEGSVRWLGSRVRVSAEMVPASGEFPVWSDRWEAELTDAFTIQDRIASSIAGKLRAGLSRLSPAGARRHSGIPEAHAAYLRARHVGAQLSPASIAKSLEYLSLAVALDPDYALAYTGLAYLTFYGMLLETLDPRQHLERASGYARRALEIDPELAEGHAIEGAIAGVFRYEWARAERHFQRAFDQDDGSAELHFLYGRWYLWPRQQWARAAHHLEISGMLDPLSALPHFALAETFYCQDRWEDAMREIESALELSPGFWMPSMLAGQVAAATGHHGEARNWFRRMADLIPGHPWIDAMELSVLAAEGKRAEAREVSRRIARQARAPRPGDWAGIHLDLGEVDAALADLKQCIEEKNWLVFWMLGAAARRRQFGNRPELGEIAAKLNIGGDFDDASALQPCP